MNDGGEYIDRSFNIRPLCFWALLVGVTLILCHISIWAAAGFIFAIVLSLVGLHFIKTKDKFLIFLGSSRFFFIGTIILCLVVMMSFGIVNLVYSNTKSFAGTHKLGGVVESYNFRHPDDGVSFMSLSNVKFNGKNISGRVIVFVSGYDGQEDTAGLEVGRRVQIQTRINVVSATAINVNNGTRYSASTRFSDIQIGERSGSVRFMVLRYTKSFLNKYLSSDNAELMYSMMFGDKSALNDEIRSDFVVGGVAHALAVSGLHVGVIILMMVGFLRLVRLRRKFQLPVVLAVLLLYCYLCGFAFPVVRASIMFLIILANRIYLRKTDLLSSVCFAGIVSMIIFPYSITSVSFQLSYACVVGIALLYRPIENLLNHTVIKIAPKPVKTAQRFFIKGATMCLCADIALAPLVIKYFGVIPVFSLLTNLFVLPVLVVCFQGAVIACVSWVGFFLLYPIEYLLVAVRWVMSLVSRISFAGLYISNGGFWFLCYFLGIIVLSRFIFVRPIYKYCAALMLFGVYSVGFFL